MTHGHTDTHVKVEQYSAEAESAMNYIKLRSDIFAQNHINNVLAVFDFPLLEMGTAT